MSVDKGYREGVHTSLKSVHNLPGTICSEMSTPRAHISCGTVGRRPGYFLCWVLMSEIRGITGEGKSTNLSVLRFKARVETPEPLTRRLRAERLAKVFETGVVVMSRQDGGVCLLQGEGYYVMCLSEFFGHLSMVAHFGARNVPDCRWHRPCVICMAFSSELLRSAVIDATLFRR